MGKTVADEIYRLLKELKFDKETGELEIPELGDVLMLLGLSFRNMVKWTAAKFGAGSSMIWYNIGRASASAVVEAFEKMKAIESQPELVRLIDAYTTVIGWGQVKTSKVDGEGKTALVQIRNSALTRGIDKGYGCDFIRGYLAGIYDTIFGAHAICDEVLC